MAVIRCDTCGAETSNSYRRCDACRQELGAIECAAQGVPATITDPATLSRLATIVTRGRRAA